MMNRNLKTDVTVIGGGTAGVFAAIAAAKSGAETLLIEKNSLLGGTMTVANVNFPGLFFAWGKQIISGPCFEAIKNTLELSGEEMPKITYKPEHHWQEQILLNRFVYAYTITEMCRRAGVKIIFNSMICEISDDSDKVRIAATGKEGMFFITCQNIIDTTGDATVVSLAGYKTQKSEYQQPATLQNHISGYDSTVDYTEEISNKMPLFNIPEYITAEKLNNYLKNGKIDFHIKSVDAHTSEGKTQVEMNALEILMQIYRLYRSVKGLENLKVDFIAEETGIRETVRIVGENTITKEDYLNGKFYPDSVCYSFYPIDLHIPTGIVKEYLRENIVPKIPYSALIPKGSRHIITAGRCISSDTFANSAVRVQATCMATGQAAGCAAAVRCCGSEKLADINYQDICLRLENIGAIVPKK